MSYAGRVQRADARQGSHQASACVRGEGEDRLRWCVCVYVCVHIRMVHTRVCVCVCVCLCSNMCVVFTLK